MQIDKKYIFIADGVLLVWFGVYWFMLRGSDYSESDGAAAVTNKIEQATGEQRKITESAGELKSELAGSVESAGRISDRLGQSENRVETITGRVQSASSAISAVAGKSSEARTILLENRELISGCQQIVQGIQRGNEAKSKSP